MLTTEGEKVSVLVVEDDHEIRRRLCWSLGADGFRAEGVADPREALVRLRGEDFSAVVADLRLARIPALDLVREVRGLEGFRPWVLYTGAPHPGVARPYGQTGVFCVLVKGAPARDLLPSVAHACRAAFLRAEARCA